MQKHNTAMLNAGDVEILPYAEEALRQVHTCGILVNGLHGGVIMPDIFFVDFSLAQTHPSAEQCLEEMHSLRLLFQ